MARHGSNGAMAELVCVDLEDHLATITLNRPDARNALSLAMLEALDAALDEIERSDAVRVITLAGEGRVFCAGMDLKAVQEDPILMSEMLRRLSAFCVRLRRVRQPTIARVNGAAIGGGCGLMVVCDFAFTHPEAKLGYPEIDLGICPAVVAPWLIMKIGAGPARAMLLAGGTMSGEEGHRAGLSTHLVGQDELTSATGSFAERLAKGGPNAMAATKAWLNELDGSMNDDALARGAEISAELIKGDEAQNRLRNVFSK